MEITKVKILSNDQVHIEFQNQNTKYVVDCAEAAGPEFVKALQSLNVDLLLIAEFPDKDLPKITITGLTVKYHGDDNVLSAIITGYRDLKNSDGPLIINTPSKHQDDNSGKQSKKNLLLPGTYERVVAVTDEAKKYVKGSRAQKDLFKDKD